jgi:hypothetical protein
LRPRAAVRRFAGPLVALTAPTAAVIVFRGSLAGLALRVWLVGVGALLFWGMAHAAIRSRAATDLTGPRFPAGWRRRAPADRLRQLEELEHAVDFSLGTAFDLHFRLRPHLVRIATTRLAARGVNLQAQPDRARQLLGPDAWDLVRPDREPPEHRAGRGADLRGLQRAVDQLDDIPAPWN